MSSNAAKEWSGTFKELEEKRDKLKRQIRYQMDQHEKLDKCESVDEVRKQRTAQTIDTLNKAYDKIDAFLKGMIMTLMPTFLTSNSEAVTRSSMSKSKNTVNVIKIIK
jgi:hypothetical protein